MSSHQDDHHVSEHKPVAFTVPLILAAVLVLIIVLFLSLCDPKPHHAHESGHNDHAGAVEATHNVSPAVHHDHENAASHSEIKADSSNVAPASEAAHPSETTH